MAGRPTKYNKEILKKSQYYLDNFTDYGDVIPSISGLSLAIDIRRVTLYDWANQKNKKEFSYMLDKIKDKQHNVLIQQGLSGEFNSNICKLVLTKHGYSDKTSNTHTGADGQPIKIEKTTIELVKAK